MGRIRTREAWAVGIAALPLPILLLAVPSSQRWKTVALIVVGHAVAFAAVSMARGSKVPLRRRLRLLPQIDELSSVDEERFQAALYRMAEGVAREESMTAIQHFAESGYQPAMLAYGVILGQSNPESEWLQSYALDDAPTSRAIRHRTALLKYCLRIQLGQPDGADEIWRRWRATGGRGIGSTSSSERHAQNRLDSMRSRSREAALEPGEAREEIRSLRLDTAVGERSIRVDEAFEFNQALYAESPQRGTTHVLDVSDFTLVQAWTREVARRLGSVGIRWTGVALASTASYLAAAVLVYHHETIRWAAIPLALAASLDIVDGHLAERTGQGQRAVLLDYLLDRLAEAAMAAGFFGYLSTHYPSTPWMPLIFGMACMYLPYIRAESTRLKISTSGDIFDRGVRNCVLIFGMTVGRPVYFLSLATSLTLHASLRRTASVLVQRRAVTVPDASALVRP